MVWFSPSMGFAETQDEMRRLLESSLNQCLLCDEIEYDLKNTVTYRLPQTATALPKQIISGHVLRNQNRFRIEVQWDYFTNEVLDRSEHELLVKNEQYIIKQLGDCLDKAAKNENIEYTRAFISKKAENDNELFKPLLCSGSYGFELDGYLDLVRLHTVMLDSGKLTMNKNEIVDGIECYCISSDTGYGTYSVWVDINHGQLMRKACCLWGTDAKARDGEIYLNNFPNSESFTVVLDRLSYREVDGIPVPVKARFQTIRKDKDGLTYTKTSQYERLNLSLHPSVKDKLFVADYPEGEVVHNLDDDSGTVYVWDGSKAIPGYSSLHGKATFKGEAGLIRAGIMLLGLLLVFIAIYLKIKRVKRYSEE